MSIRIGFEEFEEEDKLTRCPYGDWLFDTPHLVNPLVLTPEQLSLFEQGLLRVGFCPVHRVVIFFQQVDPETLLPLP